MVLGRVAVVVRMRIVLVVQNRAIRTKLAQKQNPSRWIQTNERTSRMETDTQTSSTPDLREDNSFSHRNKGKEHTEWRNRWAEKEEKKKRDRYNTRDRSTKPVEVECISFLFIQDTHMEITENRICDILSSLLRYEQERWKKKNRVSEFIVFQY